MKPEHIFWDVDTQEDFLSAQGTLYVPGSEAILCNLQRLTRWAADHHVLVVASACAHHPEDPEFQTWPPHCLVGTHGQQKVMETSLPRQRVIPNRSVELPAGFGEDQQLVIEKQELDVFTNPNTAPLLEQLGYPDVVLYGVVTELCVTLAARQLLLRGCRVSLVRDAIFALEEAKARRSMDELAGLGARTVTTGEVTQPPDF